MATTPNTTPSPGTAITRRSSSILGSVVRGGEIGCFLALTVVIGLFLLCGGVSYLALHSLGSF